MEKKEMIRSLEAIQTDKELSVIFEQAYGNNYAAIADAINKGYISKKCVNLIIQLAPICYKINGQIFAKGDIIPFDDNDGRFDELIELVNITKEMETKEQFSIYVSSTEYFPLAEPSEIVKVQKYLLSLV